MGQNSIRHNALGLSLALLATYSLSAQAPDLHSIITSAEAQSGGRIGLELRRISDGKMLYQHRSAETFTPASVVKVLTTGAALSTLGANYRFSTPVYMVGKRQASMLEGGLLIKGSGDPSLASLLIPRDTLRFEMGLLQSLQSKGVRHISGAIYIDASLPQGLGVHPSWEAEDIVETYGAGLYGLNYRDNSLSLGVAPALGRKGKPRLSDYDARSGINWRNNLNGGGRGRIRIELSPKESQVTLAGTTSRGASLRLANPDPASYALGVLSSTLVNNGVQIGKVGRRSYAGFETEGELIYTHYSKPLDTLALITNHRSQNLYAEALGSRIAPELGAGRAVERFWYERLGSKVSGLKLSDASGLSRENKLSPKVMTLALTYLFGGREPGDGVLVATLPQVGLDGTVRSFMHSEELTAYLKSGSMKGVVCYAGYIYYEGEWYTLAYLSNGFSSGASSRRVLKNFLRAIFPNPYYQEDEDAG